MSKRVQKVLVALLGLVLLLYGVDRAFSPSRAIMVRGSPKAGAGPTERTTLRLGIFNIAHGRGDHDDNLGGGGKDARVARLTGIAKHIEAQKLDVVVLNEVDFDSSWSYGVNQAEALSRALGLPFWVEQRNLDFGLPPFFSLRFGNAILSRYPLTDCTLLDYPAYSSLESLLAGKKKGVLCTIKAPPSVGDFGLIAVHLEHRSETIRVRTAQMIKALQRGRKAPLLAAGDFNSTRLGFPGAQVDKEGRSAISLLLEGSQFIARPEKTPKPEALTFSSRKPRYVIDWVLVPPSWCIEAQKVIQSSLSDHRMVVAEVRSACDSP